jgi:hypothetical protein
VASYLCIATTGSAPEIKTPKHWNLIGRNMTAQPYSSVTFILLRFHCRKGKFDMSLKKKVTI